VGNPEERAKLLAAWEAAPAARAAHPLQKPLLPLMAAVGAAGDDAAQLTVSSYRFLKTPI
jgi:hypothetical protein